MITSVQYDYQKDLESSLKGFYSNSFFHIYIDGGFDMDISRIAEDKDKGTVLHEYTHYIQNIGTLWGFSSKKLCMQQRRLSVHLLYH